MNCNIYGYMSGAFGGLLVISEILGIVKKIPANSILDFIYLCANHFMKKTVTNESTIFESLTEAFIDIEKGKTFIDKQRKKKLRRDSKNKIRKPMNESKINLVDSISEAETV